MAKAAPRGRRGASEDVLAAERDEQKNTTPSTIKQASPERQIYRGLTFIGVVRETSQGDFIAVRDEHVLGSFSTIAEATDAVLEVTRAGGRNG